MKYFAVLVIFACLAFPVFAQNTAISQRISTLGDTMGNAITKNTATLAEFDSQITDNGTIKTYISFKRKFEDVSKSIGESEDKVKLLLRTNDRTVFVKAERDNYEELLKQMQSVKSDFDTFARSAK